MTVRFPDEVAIAMPVGRERNGKRSYESCTFRELDEASSRIAAGLQLLGVKPGMRLVLMVRPSIDFISLTFALFKAGAVIVLIDPGMGRRNLIGCLEQSRPEGFVAIPGVQAVRFLLRKKFSRAQFNVTVGRRWFWDGVTLDQLKATDLGQLTTLATTSDTPAAVIFTTGSTGPPKGVGYRHGQFSSQVDALRDFYGIQPGEIDLPGFPLFALFNCAMGVTTVIPDMDPTRPAQVNPRNIVEAIQDWQVTQAFGSPALWNVVGRYCEREKIRLPSLRRVLSAGAPVPPDVLRRVTAAMAETGDVHTPYGATEALPVASIAASEVLGETMGESRKGAGTCVGRAFPGIQWKIIQIEDQAIEDISAAVELGTNEIGELIVCGAVVTPEYVTRTEANTLAKIHDGNTVWHRMGDVGYLDAQGRFWFCGRKTHRVITRSAILYSVPCEAVFNEHPRVYRSALVGVGPSSSQTPVILIERLPEYAIKNSSDRRQFIDELRALAGQYDHTKQIDQFMFHSGFPVDIRHNSKIFREKLALWAARRFGTK